MKRAPRLKPFDLRRYLGSEADGVPAPFTDAELMVMCAGSSGLRLVLMEHPRGPGRVLAAAANRYIEEGRKRFHGRPAHHRLPTKARPPAPLRNRRLRSPS